MALENVSWKTLAEIVGTSTYQYTLLYRLKLHALALWIKERGAIACPHAECSIQQHINTSHVFWDCPLAQQVWTWMRSFFALLQEEPVEYGLEEIFSFKMKYPTSKCMKIRSDWLNNNPNSNSELTTDTISAVANKYWRYAVALALTTIWQTRVDQIYNSSQITPTTDERRARFETRLQAGFDLVSSFSLSCKQYREWTAAMDTRKILRQRPARTPPNLADPQPPVTFYVGFFDGGSRGNPGPGGCGSILVEVGASGTPHIVWINTISLAGRGFTNNVAEFGGLYSLLHFIVQRRLKPAHIVGDSQLIVHMMRTRQRPKS